MNEKRIIIFTDSFPYGRGEVFFGPEINHLARSFDKTVVFPLEKKGGRLSRNIPENVELREPPFNSVKSKLSFFFLGIFNLSPILIFIREGIKSGCFFSAGKLRRWLAHFLMMRHLISFIRRKNLISFFNSFDILYFYWGLRWSQVLPFLPEGIKPKTVVRFHGSDLYEHTNAGYIPWRKIQIEKIDFPVAVSDKGRQYLNKVYNVSPDKIFLSRLGTHDYGINTFHKGEPVRIVSCSSLVSVKRVDLIARSLKHLNIKAEWIHFGDGPCRSRIEKEASYLPESIRYRFAGHVDHYHLIDFYRHTGVTLFINFSSSEGVPVSVMEALSFGIPVIATDAGGTSEIVNNDNGRLIPVDSDPQVLARVIEAFLADKRYQEYRNNARKSWEEKCMDTKLVPLFTDFLLSL